MLRPACKNPSSIESELTHPHFLEKPHTVHLIEMNNYVDTRLGSDFALQSKFIRN